jgi:putative spermidine/putrescine transport system substrate-binding protein
MPDQPATTGRKLMKTVRLALLTAGVAGLAFAAVTASAADLTITSWGGAYQTSQREAYFKPYMQKNSSKITEEEYNGEIAKIRAMVEAKDVTWDVVDLDTQTAQQGCDDGILEPIDYSKLGGKDAFLEGAAMECAAGTIVYSTVFAYDADKLKEGPTKIADLFDLKKFPGKRALQKSPFANLEFALMADGVPADQVYKVLATPEGVDRAFKKLDTIKKDVVWWEAGAQPPQLLASGEVVMTTAWNGRIYNADKNEGRHFKIIWDGQVYDFDLWGIPKGAKDLKASYDFIAFASDPAVMANQSKYISYGPTVKAALSRIAPDVLKDLPTAPQNSGNKLVANAQFWGDNGEQLRKRFNDWLAGGS